MPQRLLTAEAKVLTEEKLSEMRSAFLWWSCAPCAAQPERPQCLASLSTSALGQDTLGSPDHEGASAREFPADRDLFPPVDLTPSAELQTRLFPEDANVAFTSSYRFP
jgi:hypothetical protein